MGEWAKFALPQVMEEAKHDLEHQMLLAHCRELEKDYSVVMEELTPYQRDIIDTYLLACSRLDYRMMQLSYRCGQTHPKRYLRIF